MGSSIWPRRIGVLAYDGCLGTEVFAIVDLLLFANRIAIGVGGTRDDLFQVTVAARKASVVTAGGLALGAVPWHTHLDDLVAPGFEVSSPGQIGVTSSESAELRELRTHLRSVSELIQPG